MRKYLIAILSLIAATVASVVLFTGSGETANRNEWIQVPVCDIEDGSDMPLCVWHGSDGMDYLNYNYGEGFKIVKIRH